jgi:hypothetical protein
VQVREAGTAFYFLWSFRHAWPPPSVVATAL